MSHNLDKYVPEFDEEEMRSRLAGVPADQLTDMLVYAYKEKRIISKLLHATMNQLSRIQHIVAEPSIFANAPDIPSAEDLRRMMGEA